MVASLRVFLFRPISPMPRTLGLSRNSGMSAMTSRDRLTFSASLALMHSQLKCLMPNWAARFGSTSVRWRK